MFRYINLSGAVFALLIATAPVSAQEIDADTRASLIAFNDAFNAHAEVLDVEGMMSLYHEDALWIAPATPPAKGRDGVPRQTFTFLTENDGEITHTIDYLFVSDDGTQAVMIGDAVGSVESKGIAFKGTYHFTLVRDDAKDNWEIVADMFNQYPRAGE
ncbi:nuclear transport factor 2 family protein [Pelagibius litoralis]|uniref:Nuclear transport factor 2 family protein n=1 Tax=Pelagibius litoralis TaxID=374515 RepID=A0A967F1B8_9PROT|nr:nuclear transport factor 2 family protein [Pelagibius litoralis]NIA71321.1 nuclear transport factor 2 family protein [Pelagibius litoralis]